MTHEKDKSKKQLGLGALISLVAGNMIGSGVFLLPSNLAQLGSLSLVAWILTTLGTMLIALVFCRMSSIVTKTGGPYAYAQEGMGNAIGFQTAFCYWIAIWVGNAAIALTGIGYLSVFFPALASPWVACLATVAAVWIFSLLNLTNMSNIGLALNVLTVVKLLPIFLVGLGGWFFFHPEYLTASVNVAEPERSNFSLITHAATLTLWAFIGVESATVPSESVENPKRNIPLATLIGTGIAAIAYILSSTVIMGMLPNETLQTSVSPFADAAEVMLGEWGKWIVAVGAIISCFGCLHGWILLQGQIPMAASRDRLFPKIFGYKNKSGIPSYGVIVTSVLITLLLLLTVSPNLVKQFETIILIATFANLIPYLYTPVAEVILRNFNMSKKEWLIGILAIVYSFWAIFGAGKDVLSFGALLVMASIPLYLFVCKPRN